MHEQPLPSPNQNLNFLDATIQGSYIAQAGHDVIQGSVVYVNKSLFHVSDLLGRRLSDAAKLSAQQEYKQRKILLNKVKKYWLEDVLDKSLHAQVMLELGLEEQLDAVEHIAPEELPDKSRQVLPTATSATDFFHQMGEGRTLLILGNPGAGKTTILLTLAKNLIVRTADDLSQPIPVVFNLSSWTNKRQKITEWLIEELSNKYKVTKDLGKEWVKQQSLLLLLDGLDEVKVEYREDCVQALNRFMQEHGQTEMVVCSRIQDYEALSTRLQLQGAICVQSLTNEQIKQYLDSKGEQLLALRRLLWKDAGLQELAKSPLTLSVMTLAYENRSIAELPQIGSIEEHRQHLFNAYIERMFTRKVAQQQYPKEQVMRWLIWLAKRMSQSSQTIFLIEQMQPTWLQNNGQRKLYRFGSVLVGIIIFCWSGTLSIPIAGLVLGWGEAEIETVETLKWSWQKVRKISINELINGMILGLPIGLVLKWPQVAVAMLLGVTYGLIGWLIFWQISGLRGPEIEKKTIPNQGIWTSARNATIVGLIGALVGTLIGGIGGLLSGANWLTLGLIYGLVVGSLFGGGKACIRHFTLRFILYCNNCIPQNYTRFLDSATERILLQKVGGGYIFIHRMLLEHFAQMELDR